MQKERVCVCQFVRQILYPSSSDGYKYTSATKRCVVFMVKVNGSESDSVWPSLPVWSKWDGRLGDVNRFGNVRGGGHCACLPISIWMYWRHPEWQVSKWASKADSTILQGEGHGWTGDITLALLYYSDLVKDPPAKKIKAHLVEWIENTTKLSELFGETKQ